jgi:hypothetical protein
LWCYSRSAFFVPRAIELEKAKSLTNLIDMQETLLGVNQNLITFPFIPNAPWKKRNRTLKLHSRQQQPSNWGCGLYPRHAPGPAAHANQRRLDNSHKLHSTLHTRLKQNKLCFIQKYTQPSQEFSGGRRAHHTKSDPYVDAVDAGGAFFLMGSINLTGLDSG